MNDNAATDTGEDDFIDVVTDGGANWVAVWDSSENLSGAGTDYDIFVATSADFGATWTTPRVLNTNAATDTGDDFLPALGRDIAGNWVVVWISDDSLGGTIGTDFDVFVSTSADNGANWTSPQALNTNAATDTGHDFCPRVAVDALGNWVAVWDSIDDLGGTIGVDSDILSAHSIDSGLTWTNPQAANTTAATDSSVDFSPVIASTGARAFLTIWFSDDTLGGTVDFDADIFVASAVVPIPPVVAPISDDNVADGAVYSGSTPTLISGTTPVTWSLPSGPAGMTIDASTGVVTWPSATISGSPHTITIRTSNGAASDDESWLLTVDPVPGSSSGGGCFIATAAYGTPLAEDLNVLRGFRDRYLLTNAFGAAFTDVYYRLSPPIADRVASSAPLAALVRLVLTMLLRWGVQPYALALVLAWLGTWVALKRRRVPEGASNFR